MYTAKASNSAASSEHEHSFMQRPGQHYKRLAADLSQSQIPRVQRQIQELRDKLAALSPGSQGKAASSDKPATDKPAADNKAGCSSS
jgi:hypothetical protein|eukprot:7351617-Prymnesium_polylepis.1